MKTITVEVSDEIAKKFSGRKVVSIDEIFDYENGFKYTFSEEEKVSLNELSEFLWKVISSKKNTLC